MFDSFIELRNASKWFRNEEFQLYEEINGTPGGYTVEISSKRINFRLWNQTIHNQYFRTHKSIFVSVNIANSVFESRPLQRWILKTLQLQERV